jgi:hypothetical protein
MKRCEEAENDCNLRAELRARWPKVDSYVIADDDPRVKLRGQRGLRAAQPIKKNTLIRPYQARIHDYRTCAFRVVATSALKRILSIGGLFSTSRIVLMTLMGV